MKKGFHNLFGLLSKRQFGVILLTPSSPEKIFVKTNFTPNEVFLMFSEKGNVPVCCASQDWINVSIVPSGFYLFSKITSNERKIEWIAIR